MGLRLLAVLTVNWVVLGLSAFGIFSTAFNGGGQFGVQVLFLLGMVAVLGFASGAALRTAHP